MFIVVRFYPSAISTSAVSSNLFLTLENFWIFNFASSMSCTIKCPSALDFRSPYPKSTTAVFFPKSELRCLHIVMLNSSQDIHYSKVMCNCSILHFRYNNPTVVCQACFQVVAPAARSQLSFVKLAAGLSAWLHL